MTRSIRSLTADCELEGRRGLRGILKVLKTVLHVREGCIHGVHVGRGLVVEVEGKQLGRRHAGKTRLEKKEQNKTKEKIDEQRALGRVASVGLVIVRYGYILRARKG